MIRLGFALTAVATHNFASNLFTYVNLMQQNNHKLFCPHQSFQLFKGLTSSIC